MKEIYRLKHQQLTLVYPDIRSDAIRGSDRRPAVGRVAP